MKAGRWVFPIGALLTVGGVFLCALVEHLSFGDTQTLTYAILENSFLPALLIGTSFAIVGSFIERRRLPVTRARLVGIVCWAASLVSAVLLATTGNVHGWTFTFIFPAFVGFLTGAVLVSKVREHPKTPLNRNGLL